ncbi:MAG: molybdopterin-dependent oxidoreductase [Candidatus Thorarchaeota archaeon]
MNNTKNLENVRLGTCSKDCYGSCVFEGFWNDNAPEQKFLYARPIKDHPFTNGFFCPKYKNRENLIYHYSRLKNPLVRTGNKSKNVFKEISLKESLDLIAEKIIEIQKNKKSESILGAFYSGNSGLISQYAPLRFFSRINATITEGGICNEGGCAGLKMLFGTYSTTNPFQIVNPNTKLIVIWGSNISDNNNHAYFLIKKALKNGCKLVVIDSRKTQIAKKANCFLDIFPGTDHLLVKIIINEIFVKNAYDKDFLNKNVDRGSSIFQEATRINKKKLLKFTGVSNRTIQDFIKLLIDYKHHTLFNIGFGIQKDYYGGRIVKSIALIQIILGNIGRPGTGILYSQSDFLKPIIQPLLNYISNYQSVISVGRIPLIKLGSYLLSGKFKMLFVYNFNPMSSLPNFNLLKKALLNKDLFVVVLDLFLNETTKYADIVIPAKFDLESNDIISAYYIPSLSINIGGPCPYKNCLSNYEFFQLLAHKLKVDESPILQESENIIFKNCLKMLPLSIQDILKKNGFYLRYDMKDVPFKDLKFPTINNKIQAIAPHFNFGEKELKRKINLKKNEFLLLSPSHAFFLHSQLGSLNRKYQDDFCKVFISTKDIKNLQLESGHRVLVFNEYGQGEYILAESQILKPKTAVIYHGLSSSLTQSLNVNCFIPDVPEELGRSGAYNSAIIKIIEK